MVDFWVSDAIMKTYFPTVWWDPADNATAGQRREYPSFLRCFVDGMEGLLDAYRISVAHNEPQEAWNQALKRVASNLVKKQNEEALFIGHIRRMVMLRREEIGILMVLLN